MSSAVLRGTGLLGWYSHQHTKEKADSKKKDLAGGQKINKGDGRIQKDNSNRLAIRNQQKTCGRRC